MPEKLSSRERKLLHRFTNPIIPLKAGPCVTTPAYAHMCGEWASQGACIKSSRLYSQPL